MPDRIIRDEILESDRWTDLPSDTDRLCYISLLLICDDFGNLEGGPRRMFRFFSRFAQVKTPENTATILQHLADADLLRGYVAADRAFFHITRFRPHRQYLVRKCPPSPWDAERSLGKKQRVVTRGLAKDHDVAENLPATSHAYSMHIAQGVGVGVGVGVNQQRTTTAASGDNSGDNYATAKQQINSKTTTAAASWAQHWKSKGKALGINPLTGETEGDYCRRVQAFEKSKT